jgi:aminopeptidase N
MSATPPAAPALAVLRRLDYKPVDFTAKKVHLDISLRAGASTVAATWAFERLYTPDAGETAPRAVVLHRGDGAIQTLESIAVNGAALTPADYALTDKTLTFTPPGLGGFELKVVTTVNAEANTSLEGLYKSGSAYCTQCEAEGFRNITLAQDRPDVMAVYTVRLEADKAACPVLLSNGNLVGRGDLPDGRHYTEWSDPFPKPSYLFALVAGDLALHADTFTTVSGKRVALHIYTEHRDAGRTWWAMEALKKSFAWDETAFGLEYGACASARACVRQWSQSRTCVCGVTSARIRGGRDARVAHGGRRAARHAAQPACTHRQIALHINPSRPTRPAPVRADLHALRPRDDVGSRPRLVQHRRRE